MSDLIFAIPGIHNIHIGYNLYRFGNFLRVFMMINFTILIKITLIHYQVGISRPITL